MFPSTVLIKASVSERDGEKGERAIERENEALFCVGAFMFPSAVFRYMYVIYQNTNIILKYFSVESLRRIALIISTFLGKTTTDDCGCKSNWSSMDTRAHTHMHCLLSLSFSRLLTNSLAR